MASFHGALHIAHMASFHGALHCASIEHILCVPVRALCAHREFRTRRHSATTINHQISLCPLRALREHRAYPLCPLRALCAHREFRTRRHSSTIINHQISLCPLRALREHRESCTRRHSSTTIKTKYLRALCVLCARKRSSVCPLIP